MKGNDDAKTPRPTTHRPPDQGTSEARPDAAVQARPEEASPGDEAPAAQVMVRRGTDGAVTVTDAGLAQVTKLAADGVSEATIANVLGVSRKTLARLLRDDGDERVIDAYYTGKARLADECISTLMTHVRGGNVTACIFACKSLLGLRDQGPATNPVAGNAVQVNITIPPAMSDAEFQRRVVEAQEVKPK